MTSPDSPINGPTSVISTADAKRAARNAGTLVIASLFSKGALFAWQLILAPWLGITAYGIYGTVGALVAIGASVAAFGMGLIVIRDVAPAPEKAGRYWSAMLVMQTGLALIAYVGVNAGASGYSEAIRGFTAIAGLNLFIDMFGNITHDLLIAREQMVKTSVVEVGHILVRIGLAAVAIVAGWGLMGVYGAAIVSGIGRVVILWMLNLRDGIRPEFPFDREIAIPLLINSSPLAITAFLALAYQHADKLMTTGIIGEANTGYLTAAFVIVFGVVEMLSTTVLVATYPMMSRYYMDGTSETFGFMVEKLSFFMLLVSLPLTLTLSIFAEEITVPLFGLDFLPTAGILRLLIWYAMFTMVGNVFAKAMLIQNKQRLLLIIRSAGLGLNILLNAILLSQFRDPRGAAVASLVAELLILGLLTWGFQAKGWSWKRMLPGVLRVVVLGTIVTVLMLVLKDIHVVIGIVGGIGLYMLGVMFGRILQADDIDLLYRLVLAMPGGTMIRRYWKREVAGEW